VEEVVDVDVEVDKMKHNKKIITGITIIVLLAIVFWQVNANNVKSTTISNLDDAFKGSADASVTIVEYSDYECPFCAKFALQTLPLIDKEYIQTGKVKLIFKDFPFDFHKKAQKAAEAAQCAGEQGKYYDMHNLLFNKGVAGVNAYKEYAKELNLNQEQFNVCLDSGKMEAEILGDIKEGKDQGVKGTPAFFINGRQVTGAQPFSVFQEIIEEELKK
jgi:protein-disulfide isomerase